MVIKTSFLSEKKITYLPRIVKKARAGGGFKPWWYEKGAWVAPWNYTVNNVCSSI